MVTAQDLKDWSQDNGEDVVFDGPYMYSMSQYSELTKNFSDALVMRFGASAAIRDIEEVFDRPNVEETYDILIQCFADLINKYDLKKSY